MALCMVKLQFLVCFTADPRGLGSHVVVAVPMDGKAESLPRGPVGEDTWEQSKAHRELHGFLSPTLQI